MGSTSTVAGARGTKCACEQCESRLLNALFFSFFFGEDFPPPSNLDIETSLIFVTGVYLRNPKVYLRPLNLIKWYRE